MGARRRGWGWIVIAAALGCAQEGEPPPLETCSAERSCASGRCVEGWCVDVRLEVVPGDAARQCRPCFQAYCPLQDSVRLSLRTVVALPANALEVDRALGPDELRVDGELYKEGATYGPSFPRDACEGLTEGDHVVTGRRLASDGWIEAAPATLRVDRTDPTLVEVSPDPASSLPRAPTTFRFRYSEALRLVSDPPYPVSYSATLRTSWATYERSVPYARPVADTLEVALTPPPGGSWVELRVQGHDLAGNASEFETFTWTFAP